MDWLKKKKDEVKVAAAKLQNRRTAFKGEGNVLGDASSQNGSGSSAPVAPPPAPQRFLKNPFEKKEQLSQEEIQRRREERAQALDARGNAWDKRLNNARSRRNEDQDESSVASALESSVTISNNRSPSKNAAAGSSSSAVVLSVEEMKAREEQIAQTHGFNPYQATFSSAGEAMSAVQAARSPVQPPAVSNNATVIATSPAQQFQVSGNVPLSTGTQIGSHPAASNGNNGAVYTLLHQESSIAICAAETLLKVLGNILKNPEEPKYRRLRLSNATLQSKLFSVPGGTELLLEAGFTKQQDDSTISEPILLLQDLSRVQQTHDAVEVALTQLLHDLSSS